MEIFFWSVFSCIQTEQGDLRGKSPYSFRIQEKYGPEKTLYLDTFHAVLLGSFIACYYCLLHIILITQ